MSNFIISMEKITTLRKHTFMIYPESENLRIFDIDTTFDSNNAAITLTNNLPHSFLTGSFGVQIGVLLIKFLDDEGSELKSEKRVFVQELRTNIPSGESKKLFFYLPEMTKMINIKVFRKIRLEKNR